MNRPERMKTSLRMKMPAIAILLTITLLLCAGCATNNAEPIGHTYTVLNKEMKSGSYLLEVSSPDRHEYIEIPEASWGQIEIGDSVTFDADNELISVNNQSIQPDK